MPSLAPDTVPPETDTAALASFKALCAERGLLDRPQGLQAGDVEDGLTDDLTLLRFLQARKNDPTPALQQYESASRFRTDKTIVEVYDTISIDDYEATRKLYPHWTGRRTRTSLPILFLDVAHLHADAVAHWRRTRAPTDPNAPDMAQRACAFFDTLTRFILPLCGAAAATPVTKSIYLVDATALGLKQAWTLRDFAREISWILATCYPETIETIFVCNAPSYFSTIWGVMKKFVDPVTAAKLVILTEGQVLPALAGLVEHESIPRQFGGGFEVVHGMRADLDAGLLEVLGKERAMVLPEGPLKWREDGEGRRVLVATGSTASGLREEVVAVL
ncbi:SEC14 family lipid-binding protein [Aspergillus aculeatinus CBS 121060]|uniref:CRAL/TRIO domain-containing protein n=1 Tax=Aspergillus aculeatinus CBS 121060 TaxID=1448322 RepID=A0ACD1H1L8_9EURO|nr:CRAL/TRIO domain-containing protein [Aspergillus aculeatinus CBS 121060]RAH67448.1 CRAL/TRIO domain-containing protein [Aspergillus aculeatinus CBS 121060]